MLFVIAAVLIAAALAITSIELCAFDRGFYANEYDKLKQDEAIGISKQDLYKATENLLQYTAGERENLNMHCVIKGVEREVFNDREKQHMVDVRALFLTARDTRNVFLIAAAALIIAGLIFYRRGAVRSLLKCYSWTCGAFLFVIAALGVYAALDFTSFWTGFHQIFFTNDLWLLNENTDILIMMVPAQFFFDLVLRILILFISALISGILICGIALGLIKQKRQASHER